MFNRVYVEPRKPQGGINFVFHSYPALVKKTVRRFPHEARGILVVVDGDDAGQRLRQQELDKRLTDSGMEKRDKAEKVAICVPTRTIETWELWLVYDKHDLNESSNYKTTFQAENKQDAKGFGGRVKDAWLKATREDLKHESERLPSLCSARGELEALRSHSIK
jgi:hypothetical protein